MDMVTESAEFHLKLSAVKFKNLKGMYVYGQKLLGLDTDELEDLELEKVRTTQSSLTPYYRISTQ